MTTIILIGCSNVQIVNAHPVQKGDTSAIHGTVGLLSEEGREYASPISSNETVVCKSPSTPPYIMRQSAINMCTVSVYMYHMAVYYVRKSKPATSPQLDFQLYAGAQVGGNTCIVYKYLD